MRTASDMTVANTILQQIGQPALTMMGAWSFAGGNRCVSFRVGQNDRGVRAIRIDLNGSDLYDVTFYSIKNLAVEIVARCTDVYAEGLRQVIGSETGMDTAL